MTRCVLVTGATSGLGFEAAAQFLQAGDGPVVVTGRTEARASDAANALGARTASTQAMALGLDLEDPADVMNAVGRLADIDAPFDVLVLNAGMMAGRVRRRTAEGIDETFAASLTGHHLFATSLLARGLLSSDARIVISGSEAARGDVPMMRITDLRRLADDDFASDLEAAAHALVAGDAPKKFRPNQTYANAKVFVALWAAALARRLPAGTTVNAVSPGATPRTQAGRHKGFVMRRLMVPAMKAIPERFDMGGSVEAGARRYVTAAGFDSDVSGQFFASAPRRMSGPMQRVALGHLDDVESQEAVWRAVAKITGADLGRSDARRRLDETPRSSGGGCGRIQR